MTQVLTAVRCFVDGFDLTSDIFAHDSVKNWDEPEKTTFSPSGTTDRAYLPGLANFTIGHSGYIDPDGTTGPTDVQFGETAARVVTIAPNTGAENAVAYVGERIATAITQTLPLGEMAGFAMTGRGKGKLVRGFLLAAPTAAVSSSGNTTGLQYAGGVAAGESLYAGLHVLAKSGSPTLDVIVQSDTVGFPSPTSQITFAQATDVGAEWGTPVAGAIADDYFRINYTFGGTGDITFAVTVGIA